MWRNRRSKWWWEGGFQVLVGTGLRKGAGDENWLLGFCIFTQNNIWQCLQGAGKMFNSLVMGNFPHSCQNPRTALTLSTVSVPLSVQLDLAAPRTPDTSCLRALGSGHQLEPIISKCMNPMRYASASPLPLCSGCHKSLLQPWFSALYLYYICCYHSFPLATEENKIGP